MLMTPLCRYAPLPCLRPADATLFFTAAAATLLLTPRAITRVHDAAVDTLRVAAAAFTVF